MDYQGHSHVQLVKETLTRGPGANASHALIVWSTAWANASVTLNTPWLAISAFLETEIQSSKSR